MTSSSFTSSHLYQQMAMLAMGFPLDRPITHDEVFHQFNVLVDRGEKATLEAALQLVELLAHDYVDRVHRLGEPSPNREVDLSAYSWEEFDDPPAEL